MDATRPTLDENRTTEERPFTTRQKIALLLISKLGALAIRLIGCTLRFEVSSEETENDVRSWPPPGSIAPFWHRCVFPATYYFRGRGISVMTSRSFDGEYIARIIESFGFSAVRGSSSRGGVRALLGMHTVIVANGVAAFTIDGPRGPVYVAKPGPSLLARNTGAPIRCFYVAPKSAWTLNSWDKFLIPKPFSTVHIRWSQPIFVPKDCDSEGLERFQAEMQMALERVQRDAQMKVGSAV